MKPRLHHAKDMLMLVLMLAGSQLHASDLGIAPAYHVVDVAMDAPAAPASPTQPSGEKPPGARPVSPGAANSSGESAGPDASPETASVSRSPQRSGRLSPEERRALRRQIDEAGHDIYSRKK